MNDSDLEFFKPLWRRILTTLFCVSWSAYEWYQQQPFWGIIVGALAVYCYWRFFVNFDQSTEDNPSQKP